MREVALVLLAAVSPRAFAQEGAASTFASRRDPGVKWIQQNFVQAPDADGDPKSAWPKIDRMIEGARVVGLGEATHGQRESFALKRRLTMHFVRDLGFRVVAYEASSAKARACDDYIAGRTSDMQAALGGFGMSIWMNDENAALLDDLRAWNAAAKPADRVRFFGVDVQDGDAASTRLAELLAPVSSELSARARPLGAKLEAARDAAYSGSDWGAFTAAAGEVDALLRSVSLAFGEIAAKSSRAVADEAVARARELARFAEAATSAEGRDHAMAHTLLDELARSGDDAKVVLWAHDAHVAKGPLRYMGSTALGMGGVLAASLGPKYYAFGFLFGSGSFAALARGADQRWTFQSYEVPETFGTLESSFRSARLGDVIVDMRHAPQTDEQKAWLSQSHPMRWYGGYGIPDDVAAQSAHNDKMQRIEPIVDFDGLVYLGKTSATRMWQAAGSGGQSK